MLAKFVDAEGRERWVDVRIEDCVEVKEGKRKVVFIHELKGVEVEEIANPARLEGWLSIAKLELDATLSREGKANWTSMAYELKWTLGLKSKEEAEDILRQLCEVTGEYIVKDGWITKV